MAGKTLEPLRIFQEEGCTHEQDGDEGTLKIYPSSVCRHVTGEKLLSVLIYGGQAPRGIGLRLTEAQVYDLMNYLADWVVQP